MHTFSTGGQRQKELERPREVLRGVEVKNEEQEQEQEQEQEEYPSA